MLGGDFMSLPALSLPVSERAESVTAIDASPKALMKLADVFRLLAVSESTGFRLFAAGKIGPKAIRLSSACIRFDDEEVDAWLAYRKQDGNLHDARTWPAVWDQIKRRR